MLPLSIFAQRQFAAVNAVSFIVYAALTGPTFLLPVTLQVVSGALHSQTPPGQTAGTESPASTRDLHGEQVSPRSGDLAPGVSWRTSSRSRPSASISARTPYSPGWSSTPVKTVCGPCRSHAIAGNAETNLAPSSPLIRIIYLADPGSLPRSSSATR